MDFEISDGINKLERLGLIAKSEDKLEILNIDKCIERLEELLTLYR